MSYARATTDAATTTGSSSSAYVISLICHMSLLSVRAREKQREKEKALRHILKLDKI